MNGYFAADFAIVCGFSPSVINLFAPAQSAMAINRNSITKYPVVRRIVENEFKPANKDVIRDVLKNADKEIVPSSIGVAAALKDM